MNNHKRQQKARRIQKNVKKYNNLFWKCVRLHDLYRIAVQTEDNLRIRIQFSNEDSPECGAYMRAVGLSRHILLRLKFFLSKQAAFKLIE